jgi:hypothetical protein
MCQASAQVPTQQVAGPHLMKITNLWARSGLSFLAICSCDCPIWYLSWTSIRKLEYRMTRLQLLLNRAIPACQQMVELRHDSRTGSVVVGNVSKRSCTTSAALSPSSAGDVHSSCKSRLQQGSVTVNTLILLQTIRFNVLASNY